MKRRGKTKIAQGKGTKIQFIKKWFYYCNIFLLEGHSKKPTPEVLFLSFFFALLFNKSQKGKMADSVFYVGPGICTDHCDNWLSLFSLSFSLLCSLLFTHFRDTQEAEFYLPSYFGKTRKNVKIIIKWFSGVFLFFYGQHSVTEAWTNPIYPKMFFFL